jgi:hypothetical protein
MNVSDAILIEQGTRLGLIPAEMCDDYDCPCHQYQLVQMCQCMAEPNEDITACSACNTPYRRVK